MRSTKFNGSFAPSDVANATPADAPSPSPACSDSPPTTQSELDESFSFETVTTHQGPLHTTDKKYCGHPYSLKVKWSTGEMTWEPLDRTFEDAPDEVLAYA